MGWLRSHLLRGLLLDLLRQLLGRLLSHSDLRSLLLRLLGSRGLTSERIGLCELVSVLVGLSLLWSLGELVWLADLSRLLRLSPPLVGKALVGEALLRLLWSRLVLLHGRSALLLRRLLRLLVEISEGWVGLEIIPHVTTLGLLRRLSRPLRLLWRAPALILGRLLLWLTPGLVLSRLLLRRTPTLILGGLLR